jgi:hypothetical protein
MKYSSSLKEVTTGLECCKAWKEKKYHCFEGITLV